MRRPRPGPAVSRRAVLRAGAAAAAAAACAPFVACRGRRRVEGGFADDAGARGHRTRAAGPLGPPRSRDDAEVVVVGGGVAGLSAAWRLAGGGLEDVLLLELDDSLGGTAAYGRNAAGLHPWGAHYVPRPTREQAALCRLLEEAGVIHGFDAQGRALAREEHLCRAPQERLFEDGAWHEGLGPAAHARDEDQRQADRFQAVVSGHAARRDADGRRAFAIPLEGSARDADLMALDRVSMADWMRAEGFDSPALSWTVAYACRDDYGAPPEHVSAWAGLHYFASRVAVRGDDAAPFLTWPEGNGFLVRALAVSVPRRRTGAVVLSVEPAGAGARVAWVDAATGALHETFARRVVCATPRHVARRVVRGLEGERAGFATSPWVVANLALDATPPSPGFPIAWDNVRRDSASLGYVVATHQSDRAYTATTWTWYRPMDGGAPASERERLLETPWERWRDEIVADLAPCHDGLEDVLRSIHVRRHGHGMVRPEPGFVWGEARRRARQPVGPVHFAAADLGGLPLFEEAQSEGVRAAEEVLRALGREPEPWQ